MNFYRIVTLTLISLFFWSYSFADSHDTEQNIIEKAKEINKQIKIKQATTQANISSEIGKEEPLPLNDPFAGDGSLSGGNQVVMNNSEDPKSMMSLSKFKLVGVMASADDKGFVSLVNENGDVITLGLFEELSPGVQLVGLNNKEAVFENNESLMVINFKNQIIERAR